MAIVWGTTVNTSTQWMKLGIETWYEGDPANGNVNVWARYIMWTQYPVADDHTLNLTDEFSGSVNFRNNGGEFEIWRGYENHGTWYGQTRTFTIGGYVNGIYNGLVPSVTTTITIPAKPYLLPRKPPSAASSFNSSTNKITVSWTTDYDGSYGAQPWTGVFIYKWSSNTGSFDGGRTVSWDKTSWVDSDILFGKSYVYHVYSYNSSGIGGGVSSNTTYVPYKNPYPPTSVSINRVADNDIRVGWVIPYYTGSDGAYPIYKWYIERWDDVSKAWSPSAVVNTWNATSWTDTTGEVNRRYKYRVASRNTDGTSTFVETTYVNTTPAAPLMLGAYSTPEGDIVLSFQNKAYDPSGWEIFESTDNGSTWSATPLATVAVTSENIAYDAEIQYTHVAPNNGVPHRYRVRTLGGDEVTQGTITSAYSADSGDLQLLDFPNPPTLNTPLYGSVHDATGTLVFSWTHASSDTSAQTAFEIQVRENGGAWYNIVGAGRVVSTDMSASVTNILPNEKNIDWRVRTWGAYVDDILGVAGSHSDWSAISSFVTTAKPVVAITTPAVSAVVSSSTLSTVAWTYNDAYNVQAAYEISLYKADGVTQVSPTVTGTGTATTKDVSGVWQLSDASTYVLKLKAKDAKGLWSNEVSRTFTVAYAKPPIPEFIETNWSETSGTINLTINNKAGTPAAVRNDIFRSIDGGATWELVASVNIPQSGVSTVTDYIPIIGSDNIYKVVAYSSLPSVVESGIVVVPPAASTCGWLWLNSGVGFGSYIKLKRAGEIGIKVERTKALTYFAGREKPLAFIGENVSKTIEISAKTDRNSSTFAEISDLAKKTGPVLYRDPIGRRLYVSILTVSSSHSGAAEVVSISMSEVEQ